MQGACKKFGNVMHKITTFTRKNYGTAQKTTPSQQVAFAKEHCILIDKLDKPIGEATKEFCHKITEEGSLPLHRAFSCFLFNNKGELLLQKRSKNKITFPDLFTNTCCSHPLANIPSEKEEENAMGVRRAVIRRLNYELGIPTDELKPDDIFYLTRIYYILKSNPNWGEHEIDYLIFVQKDVTVKPNPDEVSEIRWLPRSEIEDFVKSTIPLTPWFRLIYEYKLLHWWDNLHNLNNIQDLDNITTLSI